jgi:hypothetical protein
LEEPTDSDVTPGGTILFTCIAKLNDEIVTEVTWTKDKQHLKPSRRIQILVGGTLMISNAQVDDVGVYQCSANWPNGSLKSRPAMVRFFRGRAKPNIVHK